MNFDSLYKLAVERKERSPISFDLPDGYEDQYGSADQPPAANFAQDSQSTKAPGEEYTDTDNSYSAGEAWDDIKKGAGYVRDRYNKNMWDLKTNLARPFIRDGIGPTLANQVDFKGAWDQFAGAAKGLGQDYSNITGMTDTMIKHGSPYWKQAGKNAKKGGVLKKSAREFMKWARDPNRTIGGAIGNMAHEPAAIPTALAGPVGRVGNALAVSKLPPGKLKTGAKNLQNLHSKSSADEIAERGVVLPMANVGKASGKEHIGNVASAEEEPPNPARRAAAKIEQPEEGWWDKLTRQGPPKERRASSDEVWDAYRNR